MSESLVEALDDDDNWYCEDNPDVLHNSCNVPQELSNDEIDRGRALETLAHERWKRKSRPHIWQLIRYAIRAVFVKTLISLVAIPAVYRVLHARYCASCGRALTQLHNAHSELSPWKCAHRMFMARMVRY